MTNDLNNKPLRVGVFRRLANANAAIEDLVEAGYPESTISVICPECSPDALSEDVEKVQPAGERTRQAATIGGAAGVVLGGLTAGVGVATTGGVALLFAGPLLAAGAVAGGFVGAMTTRGVEPEIADYYDQALGQGRILVAVDTGGDGPAPGKAEEILGKHGAEPIALREG